MSGMGACSSQADVPHVVPAAGGRCGARGRDRTPPSGLAQPPGHRQSPEGSPRPGGAALLARLASQQHLELEVRPASEGGTHSWGLRRAQAQSLTKRFLSRPAEGVQGHGGLALPRVKTPETRAHRCRRAGTRRKGSVHMPPETREPGAPRILLPEAHAAAGTRCRKGPARAMRTALVWPPHWDGTPATARDASCVLKTHSEFSTPSAAEETLNSLKMGDIPGRKSRFLPFSKTHR